MDFLTESERSGERLPRAARRVSGSESINRIDRILVGFERWVGFAGTIKNVVRSVFLFFLLRVLRVLCG